GPGGFGAATPEPPPLVTREIAGMDFALMSGAADLRIEAVLSRGDEEVVAATVAADIPAVEREFERSFGAHPVIYVFGSVESYADGFVRIFGYSRATATFVAENSVSFFEPSLRLIAVNWEAIRARRPVAAIRHELTHLLTLDACSPRCDLVPAWLNEGQARLAEAYSALTGRSFEDFVAGLPDRMRAAVPEGPGLVAVTSTSYLVYGFPPASTITITVSGPRGSEGSPMVISPFGSNVDSIAPTRTRGDYTVSAQTESGVLTVSLRKDEAGVPGDLH